MSTTSKRNNAPAKNIDTSDLDKIEHDRPQGFVIRQARVTYEPREQLPLNPINAQLYRTADVQLSGQLGRLDTELYIYTVPKLKDQAGQCHHRVPLRRLTRQSVGTPLALRIEPVWGGLLF